MSNQDLMQVKGNEKDTEALYDKKKNSDSGQSFLQCTTIEMSSVIR